MQVQATIKNLRLSPRKTRLVIDLVRGLAVAKALPQLELLNKKGALPITKLIKSAVANATHNHKLNPDTLVIKRIAANAGITMRRYMPRAFGRATVLRKRCSHVCVVLEGQPVAVKRAKVAKTPISAPEIKEKNSQSKASK